MIKLGKNEVTQALNAAIIKGNEEEIEKAWQAFYDSIIVEVKEDFKDLKNCNDDEVLRSRGYRVLTNQETAWYKKFIDAMKSTNPQQEFTTLIGSTDEEDLMPKTIFEDVYKDLVEQFPLLSAVSFQYVGYLTRWILNDHTSQTAVWGEVNAEITKEITSGFRTIDIKQNKLSCFAVIENDMLNLGPVFLDGYIRTCIGQAMYKALEYAIVKGTGHNEPIGLIRDIHDGVTVNSSTGYPAKSKTALTSFSPAEYGVVLANFVNTEKNKKRAFNKVTLLVNQNDYLTKIMPATTILNANGTYVNNVFPFATDVIICNALDNGDAVLAILDEYFFGVGNNKTNAIETSNEYKFLEDLTYFKVKQYGTGRCEDNTSALYLDISNLDPAFVTVQNVVNA